MRWATSLPGILSVMIALAACAPGTTVETVGGGTSRVTEPVPVDILDARFNIPFLLSEVDSVHRSLRDGGAVVHESYFSGEARVAVVEHVDGTWFGRVSITRAGDRAAFSEFLGRTPIRDATPRIVPVEGEHTVGFVAFDGGCLAFRFLKRVKGDTGNIDDRQDPDTFVAGYSCTVEIDRLVEAFGFMSPEDAARLERRTSI
jgi:hypothetical protein